MTAQQLGAFALTANLFSTLYMLGLIWFVQRVHYPLLARVGGTRFRAYERAHVARTGPVVGPAMLIEASSAVALVFLPVSVFPQAEAWIGLTLVAIIWASTALLQVPCHTRLGLGFDPSVHRRLVLTNWIRTVAWSLRGLLVAAVIYRLAR